MKFERHMEGHTEVKKGILETLDFWNPGEFSSNWQKNPFCMRNEDMPGKLITLDFQETNNLVIIIYWILVLFYAKLLLDPRFMLGRLWYNHIAAARQLEVKCIPTPGPHHLQSILITRYRIDDIYKDRKSVV